MPQCSAQLQIPAVDICIDTSATAPGFKKLAQDDF